MLQHLACLFKRRQSPQVVYRSGPTKPYVMQRYIGQGVVHTKIYYNSFKQIYMTLYWIN